MNVDKANKAKRRAMIRGLIYALLLSIIIVALGSFIVFNAVVLPIVNRLSETAEPLPKYGAPTVLEVCRILLLDTSIPFCKNPEMQTALDLQNTLYISFPPKSTKFKQIMSLLEGLRSVSTSMGLMGQDFSPGGCQLTGDNAKNYEECLVIFPGEINIVYIRFDEHERVISYGVTGSGGSS
jgi:hypothetical protein